MDQQPTFTIGVLDYQVTTERMEAEVAEEALVAAGVPLQDVHVFVPPFLMQPPVGLSATLESIGLDEAAARRCEDRYRDGNIVIVVRTRQDQPQVQEILARNGALEVYAGAELTAWSRAEEYSSR